MQLLYNFALQNWQSKHSQIFGSTVFLLSSLGSWDKSEHWFNSPSLHTFYAFFCTSGHCILTVALTVQLARPDDDSHQLPLPEGFLKDCSSQRVSSNKDCSRQKVFPQDIGCTNEWHILAGNATDFSLAQNVTCKTLEQCSYNIWIVIFWSKRKGTIFSKYSWPILQYEVANFAEERWNR